jgi:superfamily II DNA or RNA helicase
MYLPRRRPNVAEVQLEFDDGTVLVSPVAAARPDDEPVTGRATGDGRPLADWTEISCDPTELPGVARDERSDQYRAPGFQYAAIRAALAEADCVVDDRVLDCPTVQALETEYVLREYQENALDAWQNDRRGVLELPTGSGKTVIAIAAIAACDAATLVVVPTIDLLEQWTQELAAEFDVEIGQLGGGTQQLGPITVSTYDSAYLRAAEIGQQFELVVFDEVHHLGGEGYRDIARLLPAPARLGLTATFERADGAHDVIEELVGERVFTLSVDELAGEHLAEYDVKRRTVSLTPEEREGYERNQETFTEYLAQSNIRMRSGSDYQELIKRSGTDPAAREALLAKQRAREIMYSADAKLDELATILDTHAGERSLVFTAHNDLAYRVSDRFLLPVLTHQTHAEERRELLERFRAGTYSTIVTSNVLDEGVDVPDATVAVILSGSGSEREFTQRLGRILRPTDDGRRGRLYELVTEETAEERVARRRR